MDINGAVGQLLKILTATDDFIELRESRRVINANRKSVDVLENLQKKQQQIYLGKVPQDKLAQYTKEAEADYSNLSQIPEIGRYFAASEKFAVLLSNVMSQIHQGVDEGIK